MADVTQDLARPAAGPQAGEQDAPGAGRVLPPRTIVPLAGLPAVGVVLVLLVVAIAGNWLWALDFFHVVGGGLWTGIDLFVGLIVGPVLSRLSIPARVEFASRFMPKMLLVMPTLVIMTLASGWQLARHLGVLDVAYPRHWWLTAAFIVVGGMTVIALGILEPANVAVLFELRKPQPDGALSELPGHHFALSDVVAAHEAAESGVTGKVFVTIP